MEKVEIEKYKDIVIRRIWWIIIPFLLTLLAGLTHTLKTPAVYEATTLILVQPQKVPTSFVRDIVTTTVEDRLRTIKQQVTSRTNLERIIKEHHLYSDQTYKKLLLEGKVKLFRKRIGIQIARGGIGANAFTISFRDRSPKKTMKVTNALASNFITENLRIREDRAVGTLAFLAEELDSVKSRLLEKEENLKQYRQKHMGAMPEQLQTNLSILGRLQAQLERLSRNLRDAENRKLIIQKQIAETEAMQKQMAKAGLDSYLVELETPWASDGEGSDDIIALTKALALLENRYTAKHPDIIRLKKRIEKLEAEELKSEPEEAEPQVGSTEMEPIVPATEDFLKPQLKQVDIEIKDLKVEIREVQSKMELYQQRIEGTPKREQELLSLTRDYQNLKDLYNSLLNRKLEADISVSMEKKQKGEQFKVIDPAKIPNLSVEPNVQKILLLALILGLGLGGGLAYLVEIFDTSFRRPEDIEEVLHIPVLASLPFALNPREVRKIKAKKILTILGVGLGFIIAAVLLVVSIKGVDATMEFIKTTMDNIFGI